jgi:hypothetical protein
LSRPQDHRELFNLRHAQARNVIERLFGVAKRKFRLLSQGSKHNEHTQAKFVSAMGALFNFVCTHDPADPDVLHNPAVVERGMAPIVNPDHLGGNITALEREQANDRRDRIALAMWDSYMQVLNEWAEE